MIEMIEDLKFEQDALVLAAGIAAELDDMESLAAVLLRYLQIQDTLEGVS